MSLEEKVMGLIKEAMKSKDQEKLAALRAVKAELLLLQSSGQQVTEDAELKVLQKMVKQRRESSEIFKSQGREDLAGVEIKQADVIAQFLPAQLSEHELETALKKIIASLDAKGIGDLGKVMSAATREFAGKADGKTISAKVKELLS